MAKDNDFNITELAKRESLILRQKGDISIDECARLCLNERAFICELLTYGKATQECKWTSLPSIYDIKEDDVKDLFIPVLTFDLFESKFDVVFLLLMYYDGNNYMKFTNVIISNLYL